MAKLNREIHPGTVIGPYPLDAHARAIAIVLKTGSGKLPARWVGTSLSLDELLPAKEIQRLAQLGVAMQLVDSSKGTLLYPAAADSDRRLVATASAQVLDTDLQVRIAPLRGTVSFSHPFAFCALIVMWVLWFAYDHHESRGYRRSKEEWKRIERARQKGLSLHGNALLQQASLEARLNVLSRQDVVTGLPNRQTLLRNIQASLTALIVKPGGSASVLVIGIAQLRQIEHAYGADFSARMLVLVGDRIAQQLSHGVVLHQSSNAYLAFLSTNTPLEAEVATAGRLLDSLNVPFAVDQQWASEVW